VPLTIRRRQLLLATGIGVPALALGARALSGPGEPGAREGAVAPAGRRERDVAELVDAQPSVDGAGVKLRRAIGSRALPMVDPFLLLDEMHSERPEDYAAGFPTHPHRGFETVTYVLDGAVDHRDSLGNHGHLGSGSVQWMTAGRGIVHSEMPTHDSGRTTLWGFQLWVNLPAAVKMVRPRYQDLSAGRIAEVAIQDASVRLVAGEAGGARGPVEGIVTAPAMLDVKIPPRGRFAHPLPALHNAFAYVIDGAIAIGPSQTLVRQGQLAVLGPGDIAVARSIDGGRMLLVAARPIGEPVARSGPFVMNTEQELQQAWDDYRSGRLVAD
jgi:redox-sensitive bicupin YhaK (pirin superfamily)